MWSRVNRLRHFDTAVLRHTEWSRQLGSVGIAAFLGSVGFPLGIFMLIPYCAREISGPSTSLSLLIVLITTILTGLHLVEMVGRIPKSGCTYAFVYATFGELWAFLCSWMTVLDYCAMAAILAKGWSSHFDFMFHENVKRHMSPTLFDNHRTDFNNAFNHTALDHYAKVTDGPASDISWAILEEKVDLLAAVVLVATALLALLGVSVVSTICMTLLIVGMLIVSSSILVGFFYANVSTWTLNGYFIGGFEGVSVSASYLLRPMIGLEVVGSLLEETTNPQNRFAILLPVLNTILFIYQFLISLVITLVVPYYRIPLEAALPSIYGLISVPASRYVLSVASVCSLSGAVLCSLLPPVRYLHALSVDGLICRICSKFLCHVPLASCAVSLIITAIFLLVKSSVLLSVLRILLPARFIILTAAALLQRYRDTSTGLLAEVSNYKAMQVKSRSLSSFFTGGGGSRADGSCCSGDGLRNGSMDWIVGSAIGSRKPSDHYSVSSSFIMRNIAAAQYAVNREDEEEDEALFEHKERRKKRRRHGKTIGAGEDSDHTDVDQTPILDEDEVTIFSRSVQPMQIPRSATGELSCSSASRQGQRHAAGANSCDIKKSATTVSFQSTPMDEQSNQRKRRSTASRVTPTGSHNCIRSPCTPAAHEDPFYHMYQRDIPEGMPFCETFSMYAPSSTAVNQCIIYRKAKLWLGFCLSAHLAAAICIVKGSRQLENSVWWMYAMTVASFGAAAIGTVALGWLPQNADNRVRHQVPASPYLTMVNTFLLALMLASADFGGVWKAALIMTVGMLVYFIYGYRHSNEHRHPLHIAPQALSSEVDEHTGLVAPLSNYQVSETTSKRTFAPIATVNTS